MPKASIKVLPSFAVSIGLVCSCDDEIHYWLRIPRPDWKMALTLPDDHREISAEFLVFLLRHARVSVQPRIEAAAHVEDRHTCFGQRSQIVHQRRLCVIQWRLFARHDAAQ